MESSSRISIEKFNDRRFKLWKLKMEYLLVDKEQWIVMNPSTQPTGTQYTGTPPIGTQSTGMLKEEWDKLDRRARNMIRLYLADSMLLNVSR
jgi:hypothetical protein